MPRWLAISLHLRGWSGALLLAAARLPGHSACGIHRRAAPPRIPYEEGLRAALHDLLRPPDLSRRFLARPANPGIRVAGAKLVRSAQCDDARLTDSRGGWRLLARQRKPDFEIRAPRRLTLDAYLAVMRFDNPLPDREAEPRSS